MSDSYLLSCYIVLYLSGPQNARAGMLRTPPCGMYPCLEGLGFRVASTSCLYASLPSTSCPSPACTPPPPSPTHTQLTLFRPPALSPPAPPPPPPRPPPTHPAPPRRRPASSATPAAGKAGTAQWPTTCPHAPTTSRSTGGPPPAPPSSMPTCPPRPPSRRSRPRRAA